jgi:hypothetical protein
MAKHVDPGTLGDAPSDGGASLSAVTGGTDAAVHDSSATRGDVSTLDSPSLNPYPAFHGRRVSWIAIGIVIAGFVCGGLALVFGSHGPTWPVFWVGAALAVIGMLTMIATNTFQDWY